MRTLIVGSPADSHVRAVLIALKAMGAEEPLVLDAPALQDRGFGLTLERLEHAGAVVELHNGGRGWLRRYAPSGWGRGTTAGSLDAVTKRAFLSLVGSISRLGNREWVTPLDAMLRAEDRLVQLEVATSLGIPTPLSVVTSDPAQAIQMLGPEFIVKPLSLGFYRSGDQALAVYTTKLDGSVASGLDFGAAPFLAQEMVTAIWHYRIVTVGTSAWVARLPAAGRPLDWRRDESAHREWQPVDDLDIGRKAVRLTTELGIGYSSQDWLVNQGGSTFLDLNPGGQWLFLPDEVSTPATQAIANFLMGQ